VQSFAPGREYTVNACVDRAGHSLCEIPHERLLVSEGGVVRGRTARIPDLIDAARRIAELHPGPWAPLNIQAFRDDSGARPTVIGINPRFGGGCPLAHEAGARFAEWLLAEHLEGAAIPRLDAWTENLLMVRYREAMFVAGAPEGSGRNP
jgi:carbamoyl-phosphate synthase large subunit